MLRIPAWSNGATVKVNGKQISTDQRVRGYLRIARTWNPSDVIELNMPLPVRQVHANPLVQANVGRSVLMRGPLVYCVESADNATVQALSLPQGAKCTARFEEAMLGGIVVVSGKGSAGTTKDEALYSTRPQIYSARVTTITAIPYYANANRGPVDMMVWFPLST